MHSQISVVITNYKNKHLLNKCLDSFISKLNDNDQVLIYDDSSGSEEEKYLQICEAYNQVHVIRNSVNVGTIVAKNNAIIAAKYNNIILVDGDDELIDDYINYARTYFDSGHNLIISDYILREFQGDSYKDSIVQLGTSVPDIIKSSVTSWKILGAVSFKRDLFFHVEMFSKYSYEFEDVDLIKRMLLSPLLQLKYHNKPYYIYNKFPTGRNTTKTKLNAALSNFSRLDYVFYNANVFTLIKSILKFMVIIIYEKIRFSNLKNL